jgi:hypothetical protein
MSTLPSILANAEFDDMLGQWRGMSATTREGLIIFGALMLVTTAVTVWAVYVRKPKRRKHRHHHGQHHSREAVEDAVSESADDDSEPRKRRRWRRQRRDHHPRNPTLAETGGLPPVRTGGPPDIQP